MSKLRVLDMYCAAGGAGMGYSLAGFEVVGVDHNPQPNYPFEFHQGDVMELLSRRQQAGFGIKHTHPFRGFDAIHASPPCQAFSAYRRKGHGVGEGFPDLIEEVRGHLISSGLAFVIENVPGAPLRFPVTLCGSSFNLDVRRHRWFESNVEIDEPPCQHEKQMPRFPPATNRTNLRSTVEVGVWRIPLDVQQEAMGIDWMTRDELSQAIPPAYTEHIGQYLMAAVEQRMAA